MPDDDAAVARFIEAQGQREAGFAPALAAVVAVNDQLTDGRSLIDLRGSSVDAMKLVSSLTLFSHVARQLSAESDLIGCEELAETAEAILAPAAAQGHPRCAAFG